MLKENGTKAPEFTLPDQDGVLHSLSDYRGQKVILYFYPKDNTAGCTAQACSYRDLLPQFQEKGAVVLGINKDSIASHKKFAEKYSLPFTLLSDPEGKAVEAYGAWQEKKNYGRTYWGIVRSTFLIDEEGTIVKSYEKVKAKDDPAARLQEL